MALTKVNTDLLADGGKLNGIEAGADVTDTTNVTAAGALMDSELTSIASVKALDQGVATTDSPTFAGLNASGNLTLDVAGDIILDADGREIKLKDAGLEFGVLYNSNGDFGIYSSQDDKDMLFQGSDAGSVITALTLDMSNAGAATFNSTGTFAGGNTNFTNDADVVTLNGSLHTRLLIDTSSTGGHQAAIVLESNGNQSIIGNTGSNTSFAVATGDLTLDVAGNINLDADGGSVFFKDAGTEFFKIRNTGSDVQIYSARPDADMKFEGVDGSVGITALTLDMSNAGAATFNDNVYVGGDLFVPNLMYHTGDLNTYMQFHGADSWRVVTAGAERLHIEGASVVVNSDGHDADFRVESGGNANMLFVDGGSNTVGIGTTASADETLTVAGEIRATGNDGAVRVDSGSGGYYLNLTQTYAHPYSNSYIQSVAGSSYHGRLVFEGNSSGGSMEEFLRMSTPEGVVFNEDGIDKDFRVESDTNTHALFVDGGNSRVGINQTVPAGDFHVTGGADSLIFLDGTTSVANSPTTLFTISLPGTANAVFVTLFVHGISAGIAWFAFKQDFVASRGGTILATAGDVVETSGGGTMTLNTSGSNLNVQFHHASSTADTMNWSAVIQGKPGTIS
jgi:hypothetical protein